MEGRYWERKYEFTSPLWIWSVATAACVTAWSWCNAQTVTGVTVFTLFFSCCGHAEEKQPSWLVELLLWTGKRDDTGKPVCVLTSHRGQNWIILDKEGKNKIIYSCCSQWTKEPVFQVPNSATNTQLFLSSMIRRKVKTTKSTEFLHNHTRVNRGHWHGTTCILYYKDFIYFNLATYCSVPYKWTGFSSPCGWALWKIEESEESVGALLEDTTAGWCDLLLAIDHMLSRVCAHKHSFPSSR